MQIEGCDDWGSNLRIRGVQAPVCKPLLSVGEYTTKGGVTVLYGDKGYMFHKGSNVAKKMDAWVQKELMMGVRWKRRSKAAAEQSMQDMETECKQ